MLFQLKITQTPVGTFFAIRSSNVDMSAGSTVVFNTAHYNPDGDYDPFTGIFTCPLDGTYVFHVSVTGVTPIDVCLYRGGVSEMRFRTGSTDYNNGAGMSVAHCTSGQNVYVVSESSGTVAGTYSHFSGFLLHADPLE